MQDSAVKSIKENNYIGLLQVCTGAGKSIILQKIIMSCYNDGLLKKGDTVWILCETRTREYTFF